MTRKDPAEKAIRVRRKLNSIDVIDALSDLFILRGVPAFIRSGQPCQIFIGFEHQGIVAFVGQHIL